MQWIFGRGMTIDGTFFILFLRYELHAKHYRLPVDGRKVY
jgi:hypothetical protein